MLSEWKRNLLTADLDLRLCRRDADVVRVFRIRTKRLNAWRLALGLMFCAPAIALIFIAIADPYFLSYPVRIGMLLLAIFPMVAGLFLGLARIEKRFDLARKTATLSISFLGFESDLEETIPAVGTVSLTSQWDEGPYWIFRASADGIEGATFTICADYLEAVQFGQELAAFLGWPFQDLTDRKSH